MERAGTADLVGDKEAVVNHVIRYVRITQGVDIQQVPRWTGPHRIDAG
jgi:hypothetical protein